MAATQRIAHLTGMGQGHRLSAFSDALADCRPARCVPQTTGSTVLSRINLDIGDDGGRGVPALSQPFGHKRGRRSRVDAIGMNLEALAASEALVCRAATTGVLSGEAEFVRRQAVLRKSL